MDINHNAGNVLDTVNVTEDGCKKYITDIRKIQSYEEAIRQIINDFYNKDPYAFVTVCCGAIEAVNMADTDYPMVYSNDHKKLLELVEQFDTPSILTEYLMNSKEYDGIVALCASIPYMAYPGL